MHTHDQNSPLPQSAPGIAPEIVDGVPREQPRRMLQSVKTELIDRARPLLFGGLAICMLLSIALYNGYPTIFSDTGSYLLTGKLFVAFVPFRAPGYSMFTRVTSLGTSAWFTIAMQAIIVVYVLYEACDY